VGKGGPISVEYGILASMPNPGAGEARVRVSRDNRSIVVREMDNEFPKWRRLIDAAASGATLFAEVRKVDLVSALAGVHVDLTFQPGGTVTVDSRRSVADDVLMSQVVAADIASDDGLPVTVRMSTEYLGAALKAIPADVVTVQMATPTRPVLLSGGGDTHLVMPQRIPS
jgi:DNA polymerase III sliding clamp (beta) subunit (PCNA family)